jgi:hypothetical protein
MAGLISFAAREAYKAKKKLDKKLETRSKFSVENNILTIDGTENALFFIKKYEAHEENSDYLAGDYSSRRRKSFETYLKKKYSTPLSKIEQVVIQNADLGNLDLTGKKFEQIKFNNVTFQTPHPQEISQINVILNNPAKANKDINMDGLFAQMPYDIKLFICSLILPNSLRADFTQIKSVVNFAAFDLHNTNKSSLETKVKYTDAILARDRKEPQKQLTENNKTR